MSDVTLSAAVRQNLLSLQNTTRLIDRTQNRMASGMKISSPIDDAVKFFQAKSLSDRARDLNERKAGIDQGVSALETALKAAEALEDLVQQMKGVIDSARSADKTQRVALNDQVKELADQIQKLVDDTSYQGLNLLNSTASKLSVRFSEKSGSKLEVNGVNFNKSVFFKDSAGISAGGAFASIVLSSLGFTTGGLSVFNLSVAADLASYNAQADSVIMGLDETISSLRSKSSTLANNVAILKVRADFTQEYINVLDTGAGKLTVADLNEEGANLLALQTRQQLGIQAMSFAAQAEQSILGLFR
ncbi:MAG TPA: flagellin [Rhodospirillales bacterium]|nr:flagellin [Rhodospirillales bacterium]